MATKYVKNPSGYCYKIQGNKKVRISKEEYMKKNKKTKGGQYDSIHPSNIPQSLNKNIKICAKNCNDQYKDKTSIIQCIKECR